MMNRTYRMLLALALTGLALLAPTAARAEFGLSEFDVTFSDPEGAPERQAGSHPEEMSTFIRFISKVVGEAEQTEEAAKDIILTQPEGFAGNPTATERCETAAFLTRAPVELGLPVPDCPDAAALGVVSASLSGAGAFHGAIYNLTPPPGVAAKLGFWIATVPITLELGVSESPPYNIVGGPTNTSQIVELTGSEFNLWGNPGDQVHDPLRGHCLDPLTGESTGESCTAGGGGEPFLIMPRSCAGPLVTSYAVDSWQNPGAFLTGSTESDSMTGCGKSLFSPERVSLTPLSAAAESATGIEIAIDIDDPNVENPEGVVGADIEALAIRFAAGMTINPSAAEGLGACSFGQFGAARLDSGGCPESSKLGEIEVDTPILENHTLKGSFYLAAQGDNPFGSLLAAYLFIRDPELGIFMKLPTRIETDPASGRIEAITEELPPFPLERVRVRLRSGPRAPLVTPPSCGTHVSTLVLTPSTGAPDLVVDSPFQITSGPGGAPCPSGSPSFAPGFEAGSENPAAGAYSPFSMRLTRQDAEQDLTRFSAVLPPGETARLAGVEKCSDAAVAGASSRDGRDELASPSCPPGSGIGRVVAGAGVGTALTYVNGSLYLAGPYNGAPLSVAAIVPAVAGPFDVGTVVTRVGLRLNPKTGQGEVDGAASDPIPHILEGIPLKVRDIRVLADRPGFTLNPTNCKPSNTLATIWGGGSNFLSAADDVPVGAAARFQAASCASLAFKPKLAIKLFGGVRRGQFPALRAIVTPPPGQANFARAAVTLPRSAFLEQGHIRTICTRVQFAAGPGHGALCPKAAQYGYARAWSPLLDAPAQGPVYLRSSSNKLPDLVVALKGPDSVPVDVELSARIDSVRGGIRSIFTGIPDLPVSRFILDMQGGKKGLIVNSRHLCYKPKRNRAKANLRGQNGRFSRTKPRVIATACQKRRKKRRAKRASVSRALIADQEASRR